MYREKLNEWISTLMAYDQNAIYIAKHINFLEDFANWLDEQSAQHSVQRTAFVAFCGGVIFGMFVMFVLGALL